MPTALDFECPYCGAAPRRFCTTAGGATRPAHAGRLIGKNAPAGKALLLCHHGLDMLQGECAGCDLESQAPHAADMVKFTPARARYVHARCLRCRRPASHRFHTA